jgi:hypothetical protein
MCVFGEITENANTQRGDFFCVFIHSAFLRFLRFLRFLHFHQSFLDMTTREHDFFLED